jgi:succinyl-diaminopimelate desuccinylase
MMNAAKQKLLDRIDGDRELLVAYLSDFIRLPSPNPPGDTLRAAQHVRALFDARGISYRVIAPEPTMPNIVASFDGGKPGRHLALNGHIDVFPAGDGAGWSRDPWGGELIDGRIYGRGACDMKSGTTASIFTFLYLHDIREQLHGRLTLSIVSDEETFGPWGARYLIEHHPEIIGDCCLNAEPTGRNTFRFGEKGPLWLRFTVRTHGAHGAYVHRSASATSIASKVIGELEALADLPPAELGNLTALFDAAAPTVDREWGVGAAHNLRRITVNPGLMRGGVKVNMVAAECVFEVDIRLPNGFDDADIRRAVNAIVARYPDVSYEQILYNPPNWTAPDTEMAGLVRANAKAVSGIEPMPVVSLGCTDARLWRYKDVPAIVFGPSPIEMGGVDEYVEVEEFLDVVRTHTLSAYDYLSGPSPQS